MTIDQIRAKYVTDTPLSTLERFAKEMYGGDPSKAKTPAQKKVAADLEKAKKANQELTALIGLKNDLVRAYKLLDFHSSNIVGKSLSSATMAVQKAIADADKAIASRQKIVG
ncbi:MAG: hypothetical protein IKS96_07170 [Fibrobacter sp.]|nr:hypothetical protein [Fibrobacter sp.]MBR6449708.1 hypothetical protein [Fibrobacter sp.]